MATARPGFCAMFVGRRRASGERKGTLVDAAAVGRFTEDPAAAITKHKHTGRAGASRFFRLHVVFLANTRTRRAKRLGVHKSILVTKFKFRFVFLQPQTRWPTARSLSRGGPGLIGAFKGRA